MIPGWSTSHLNIMRSVYLITPITQLSHMLKRTPAEIERAAEQLGLNGVKKDTNPKRKEFLESPKRDEIRAAFKLPALKTEIKKIAPRKTVVLLSGFSDKHQSFLLENYATMTTPEIAKITGLSRNQIAYFAKHKKLYKTKECRKLSIVNARAFDFQKKLDNSNSKSTKVMLVRKLNEALQLIKCRDHAGALEAIEAALSYSHGRRL